MNECQVCGEPVPDGDGRCPQGHYQLATCALCGTERARDIAACPNCGSTWLDYPYRKQEVATGSDETAPTPIGSAPETVRRPRPAEAELTAATMHQPWRPPGEDPPEVDLIDLRESAVVGIADRWPQIARYAAIVVVAVGLVAAASYTLGELGSPPTTPPPTVAALTSTRETTLATPAVSVDATNATNTTTSVTTTSPRATTTTTLFVQPVGEAVSIDDLRMTIYGIGDLLIGDPEDHVTGVLAATFGQPDAEMPVEPALAHPGACPGSASRVLRWGILEITLSEGVFSGYRLDTSIGDPSSATAQLRTVSGLRVGITGSNVETIFPNYRVVYEEKAGFGPTFSLRRSNDEELLWGPMSAAGRAGTVQGIYSPSGCS